MLPRIAIKSVPCGRALFLPALVCLALTACSGKEQAGGPPPGGAMPVSAITVQPTQTPIYIEAVGQTEGAKEIEVRARVGGILMKRFYEEGTAVHAGQSLFELDRAPLETALANAKAVLAEQQARLEQAQRELKRTKGLTAVDAASRKELDDATSNEALLRAQVQAAEAGVHQAELNLGYAAVPAPAAGISGRAQKTEGNLIAAGDLLTSVVQTDPIKVRFALSESDAAAAPGKRFDVRKVSSVQIELADGTRVPARGTLDFAATQIDPKLGTRSLRAAFANPDTAILPGQFVKVRLQVGTREGTYRVPQVAVMQTDQGFIVMTVDKDKKVAPRPVQVGPWDGKDWIILGGLQPGDQVIVDNLIKLRPGAPVMPHPPGVMPPGMPAKKG